MYGNLMKKFVPLPKIESFENYLFVGPHPDDIEVACAPTAAKLVAAGKKVTFLVATDGRAGTTDPEMEEEKLFQIRRKEAENSAKLLGADIFFLDYRDGGMYSAEDLAKSIAKKIVEVKPQMVFAPDPNTRSECHPDHIKTGEATLWAATLSGFCGFTKLAGTEGVHSVDAVALYFTDRPNAFVSIKKFSRMRKKCLELFPSQFGESDLNMLGRYLSLREIGLGLPRFMGRADGYRVMAAVHMHCVPEASKW